MRSPKGEERSGCSSFQKKSGGTWALPIVPKMPQKSTGSSEKRKGLVSLPKVPLPKAKKKEAEEIPSQTLSNSNRGLANVWLQAFGAKPTLGNNKGIKQEAGLMGGDSKEKLQDIKLAKKTYLDIPPEKRRRPKPNYGGLIHFSPDWERAVQKHHEISRLPQNLVDGLAAIRVRT